MIPRWPAAMAGLFFAATAVSQPASPAARLIARGIDALHDFEYEEANAAFQEARAADPASALACWGEAMTYSQTLWRNEDVTAGRQALGRFAPTAGERAAKASGPKEQALLAAVEQLFGPGDAATRRQKYAEAMARAHDQVPDDADVAAFYALALLGTMSRSLIGNGDAHDPALAGSVVQRQVAALLTGVLTAHPQHRGALHYLIHDYDDPEHAALALPAARAYAAIAARSSHARHMPAHVFLQLGLWHEAEPADRGSFAESDAWAKRRGFGLATRNYHALAWLQYELLQLGRYRDAAALLDEIKPVVSADASHRLLSDYSSMRARVTVETRRWDTMAREDSFGNADDLFAIGMSTARTGALDRAEKVRQALAQRANATEEGDFRPAIAIMERETAGLIALGSGRREDALAILRAAAEAENHLPAPLGLPQPVKPAPELLGEALLEAGHPAEAASAFQETLRRHANRSLSVLGAARAAAAQHRSVEARKQYRQLLTNFDHADTDLAEVAEARAALKPASKIQR